MISLKWLKITLCFTVAYASQNDPGPQYFVQSTPSPVTAKPGYVMKDVILYLTPSQIRALEATQGLNKVVPFGKPSEDEKIRVSNEDLQKLEAELNRQLEHLRVYEKQNDRRVQFKPPTPIVEPNTEKPIPFAPDFNQEQQKLSQANPEHNFFLPNEYELKTKLPESYSYIKFFTDNEAQEKPKVQVFQPFPHEFKLGGESFEKTLEIQKDPIHQKPYKLIPYVFADKNPEQLKQELISQVPQFPSLFSHLNSESSSSQTFSELLRFNNQGSSEIKNLDLQKQFADIRYAAKFEDQKQAADFQRFVAKIEKENALAHAEALKKAPAEIIKKEESITKLKTTPIFKQFNTPLFKPFYVTSPLAFKRPQPYQIPIQVVQAFPNLKTESFEAPKGILEVERYVPAELKNNEQFEISVNNPEKSSTLRHVWKH